MLNDWIICATRSVRYLAKPMARLCPNCDRELEDASRALCTECAPPDRTRQDATIRPGTVHLGGEARQDPTTATVLARVYETPQRKGKKPPLEVRRDDGMPHRDRGGNPETREIVNDREHDFYRQRWTEPETNDVTFEKAGRRSDPNMHGSASWARSKPLDEP